MEIHYPVDVDGIPIERQEELERDIRHFLNFTPCQRLRYIEKEWIDLQNYIKKFGMLWNQKSN